MTPVDDSNSVVRVKMPRHIFMALCDEGGMGVVGFLKLTPEKTKPGTPVNVATITYNLTVEDMRVEEVA